MIHKLKKLYQRLDSRNEAILAQTKELEWAQIYHDTIRGRKWLDDLSLSPGRWAGNYSFFYVLNRILMDYKPQNIIEFGLGESTKVISRYLEHELPHASLTTIDHSQDWVDVFSQRFKLSDRVSLKIFPCEEKNYKGANHTVYKDLAAQITSVFDLYIIDGPFGSDRYSRFDIVSLAEKLTPSNEFIILMDDCHRKGEQETINELEINLKAKGIRIHKGHYEGNKSQIILATEKYKYSISL